MSESPLELAVVVPTFNERANVAALVAKLDAALTGRNWEAIFVDDNSPDGTADAARAIARADPRVRVIQRIGRRGLSSACIEGMCAGSIGMLPSASLSAWTGANGMYEPIHGSAPDIAGQGKANPCAAILSAAMLLRHSLGDDASAKRVEAAVSAALIAGARTADLGGSLSTREMGDAVLKALA